jgi:uncharacterized protein (DUF1697 family)
MNAKMSDLKKAFETAGFERVATVLGSGNVVFDAVTTRAPLLERKAEAAMMQALGRTFLTIVRPLDALERMLDADPFARFRLASDAKRVVTFLREPPKTTLGLPLHVDGARILAIEGREVFTAYVPSPKGAAFMALIERTFGKDITTRTWDTVRKVVVK